MARYVRIVPWPQGDFTKFEALVAPDRSEGVAVLYDGQPDPSGGTVTVLANVAAYDMEKSRIRALVDAFTPPPDPLQTEIAWARGVLMAADTTWTGATENQFRLNMKRILRLYGRLLRQLSEGE